MKCPFCDHELTMVRIPHFEEEEYELGCEHCGARGAIFRKITRDEA